MLADPSLQVTSTTKNNEPSEDGPRSSSVTSHNPHDTSHQLGHESPPPNPPTTHLTSSSNVLTSHYTSYMGDRYDDDDSAIHALHSQLAAYQEQHGGAMRGQREDIEESWEGGRERTQTYKSNQNRKGEWRSEA